MNFFEPPRSGRAFYGSAPSARLTLIAASAILILLSPSIGWAHGGGTPRLTSEHAGPYSVYAWSEPEPVLTGDVHLSIAVTQPAAEQSDSGQQTSQIEVPVTDSDVVVTFSPAESTGDAVRVVATNQSTLNDVYYEAEAFLPRAGEWRVVIAVQGQDGSGEVSFDLDVQPARQMNWYLVGAGGLALLVIIGSIAVWSRTHSSPIEPAPRRRRHAS